MKSIDIVTGYGKTRMRGARQGDDGMRKRVRAMLRFMRVQEVDQSNKGRIHIDKEAPIQEVERNGGKIVFDAKGYWRWRDEQTTANAIPDVPQVRRLSLGGHQKDLEPDSYRERSCGQSRSREGKYEKAHTKNGVSSSHREEGRRGRHSRYAHDLEREDSDRRHGHQPRKGSTGRNDDDRRRSRTRSVSHDRHRQLPYSNRDYRSRENRNDRRADVEDTRKRDSDYYNRRGRDGDYHRVSYRRKEAPQSERKDSGDWENHRSSRHHREYNDRSHKNHADIKQTNHDKDYRSYDRQRGSRSKVADKNKHCIGRGKEKFEEDERYNQEEEGHMSARMKVEASDNNRQQYKNYSSSLGLTVDRKRGYDVEEHFHHKSSRRGYNIDSVPDKRHCAHDRGPKC